MECAADVQWYVATYGNAGLEVKFYSDWDAYGQACADAQEAHEYGKLDSYTNGEID